MSCRVRADPQILAVEAECKLEQHPHRTAHYAAGETEDGMRWSAFWWSTTADPDAPANE